MAGEAAIAEPAGTARLGRLPRTLRGRHFFIPSVTSVSLKTFTQGTAETTSRLTTGVKTGRNKQQSVSGGGGGFTGLVPPRSGT